MFTSFPYQKFKIAKMVGKSIYKGNLLNRYIQIFRCVIRLPNSQNFLNI